MSTRFSSMRCSLLEIAVSMLKLKGVIVVFCFHLAAVSGNECDIRPVEQCYQELKDFEGPAFPYYGGNEQQLDETCGAMNATFECIGDFLNLCDENPKCDDECMGQVSLLTSISKNSGLLLLYNEMCVPGKLLRHTYLENYDCIANAEEKYQTCYNASQVSLSYIKSIEDPDKELLNKCCFFSWYPHCYTDATMNQCSLNATFFVSYSLHILLGYTEQLCADTDIKCTQPPMAEDGPKIEEDMPAKKTTDIDDNSVDGSAKMLGGTDMARLCPLSAIASVLFLVLSRQVFFR